MIFKVTDLIGTNLDWAVEFAKGTHWSANGYFIFNGSVSSKARYDHNPEYAYSKEWSVAGLIIEQEHISLEVDDSGVWVGYSMYNYANEKRFMYGDRLPLVAAMRCFVASKLGNEIDIPEAK